MRVPSPFGDLLAAIDAALVRTRDLVPLLVGAAAAWWVYVPVHELLHALACIAAGGSVTRLEVAPIYGGHLLAAVFPWVVAVDGPYAGRLAGFDTGGSDLVYAATTYGPFLLALFPGVWGLRKAGARRSAFLVGAAAPLALAPWLSLTGDAYELGSLLVTNLPPWSTPELATLVRGDDVFVRAEAVAPAGTVGWLGLALSQGLGIAWAVVSSLVAARLARALGAPPQELAATARNSATPIS